MTGGPPPQPRSRRGPRPETDDANDPSTARHECRPWAAADEIQQAGFVILSRSIASSIERGQDVWWLIVARKL